MEGETFPFELLGEEKVKESLGRVVKAAQILSMNFGRIYLDIGEEISLKKYLDPKKFPKKSNGEFLDPYNLKEDRKVMSSSLGYDVIYNLTDKLVI